MGNVYLRYVRDKSAIVHVWDYIKDRADYALCGHGYLDPLDLDECPPPKRLCRKCKKLTPRAEAIRYRQIAELNSLYADELQREYDKLWSAYNSLLWN